MGYSAKSNDRLTAAHSGSLHFAATAIAATRSTSRSVATKVAIRWTATAEMKTITTTVLKTDSWYSRRTASRFLQPIGEGLRPHIIAAVSDFTPLLQLLPSERLLMVRVLRTELPAFVGSNSSSDGSWCWKWKPRSASQTISQCSLGIAFQTWGSSLLLSWAFSLYPRARLIATHRQC